MEENKEITSVQMIPIDLLEENEGQLFGLPANPREIADEKYELLKADIQKYPQFLQYNALKVYPIEDGKYIVIGGNMRYRALKELGFKEVPCVVIPKETPVEDLKAYVILDNSGFGRWDCTMLSSEDWDAAQLEEWGLDCEFLMQDIDYIDDINGDGLKNTVTSQSDLFAATFNLPKDCKMAFDNYIKTNGKQNIVDLIISEVCQDVEAK